MIYRRHDPPPPTKSAPRAMATAPAQSRKSAAFRRGVIRAEVCCSIAGLRRDGMRSGKDIEMVLDVMEAAGALDGFTCHSAVERLAKALLEAGR
jgi:hypothetical protein